MATPEQIRADFDAVGFELETTAEVDAIHAVARAVAGQCRKFGSYKVVEAARSAGDGPDELIFICRVGGHNAAAFSVDSTCSGDTRRVSFAVLDYQVIQAAVAGFIPAGRKHSPALPAAKRFSEMLRSDL